MKAAAAVTLAALLTAHGPSPASAQEWTDAVRGRLEIKVTPEIVEGASITYRYEIVNAGVSTDRLWALAIGSRPDGSRITASPRGWQPRRTGEGGRFWSAIVLGADRPAPKAWGNDGPPVLGWQAPDPRWALRPGGGGGPFVVESRLLPAPVPMWAVGRPKMGRETAQDSVTMADLMHSRTREVTVGPGIAPGQADTAGETLTLLQAMTREACSRGWIERRSVCTLLETDFGYMAEYLDDENYMAVIGPARALEFGVVSHERVLEGYVEPVAMELVRFYTRRLVEQAREAHRDRWY